KSSKASRRNSSPSALDEAITEESIGRLFSAIDSLPENLRLVIHLRVFEGLSYREIAEVTGLSTDAVSVRLHRARKALKQRIGHAGFPIPALDLERWRNGSSFQQPGGLGSRTKAQLLAREVFCRPTSLLSKGFFLTVGLTTSLLLALLKPVLHERATLCA